MDAGSASSLAAELSAHEPESQQGAGPRRVLFVCWGNICRSPTAEGVFRAYVAESGLDGTIEIDSAGTISYHEGEAPDARMREAAARRGYTLDGTSRKVAEADFRKFDLIVAMDRDNLNDLEAQAGAGRPRLRLFGAYLSAESPVDVPDPYYGGASGFDRVLDMIEAGCPELLEELMTARPDAAG